MVKPASFIRQVIARCAGDMPSSDHEPEWAKGAFADDFDDIDPELRPAWAGLLRRRPELEPLPADVPESARGRYFEDYLDVDESLRPPWCDLLPYRRPIEGR